MFDKETANYKERYRKWLAADWLADADRAELLDLSEAEIAERFYCDLEFGTGGMRGELGIGTNRMNIYLIRRLTRALASVVLEENGAERGVAIAYDSRRMSREFAEEAAGVLAANGVRAHLFASLRPTPMLSFAVRELGAKAGIMITASHNPKQYNGYKVYWEDGAQLPPEAADRIVAKMREQAKWDIKAMPWANAKAAGLVRIIGKELDDTYRAKVKNELQNRELCAQKGAELGVVYSALCGTGQQPVTRILRELGFSRVFEVLEQSQPDPEFATLQVPNPEDEGAWILARKLARRLTADGIDVDLLLATDPDADRLGVCCRDKNGEFVRLSGNQVGVLLADYLIGAKSKNGTLPKGAMLIKSVVSTAMADSLAMARGVECVSVPVGFKYIGEQIKLLEEKGEQERFIFGFEESLGYLCGTYARDKDAPLAAALMAEAALYYKQQGKSLLDVLAELYAELGYYCDEQVALTFTGRGGKEKIAEIMRRLHSMAKKPNLGAGDMFVLDLPEGGRICVRPSGTEPKIRFYFCVRGKDEATAKQSLEKIKEDFLLPLADLL